jgi:hypothetical protein
MVRQPRIKGGEKNIKSGQRWIKEELNQVLNLYVSDRQLKIHESNKAIQTLAIQLGRTTRSVEAQLLMFRNLDKFGYYGYGNMNKICRTLWNEYINNSIREYGNI